MINISGSATFDTITVKGATTTGTTGNGGAIYFLGASNTATLAITNSSFANTSSRATGGALAIQNASEITLDGITSKNTRAARNGGFMSAADDDTCILNMKNSIIENSYTTGDPTTDSSPGGALAFSNTELHIENVDFIDCNTLSQGKVAYLHNNPLGAEFINCHFTNTLELHCYDELTPTNTTHTSEHFAIGGGNKIVFSNCMFTNLVTGVNGTPTVPVYIVSSFSPLEMTDCKFYFKSGENVQAIRTEVNLTLMGNMLFRNYNPSDTSLPMIYRRSTYTLNPALDSMPLGWLDNCRSSNWVDLVSTF
jgi:hypothetical protein